MSELKHQLMLNKERSWVPCYLKSEADKVIADKDKEIYNIKYSRDEWAKACNQKDKEIEELKEERRWRKFPDEKPEHHQWILVYYPNHSQFTTGVELRRWDEGCKYDVELQEIYDKWMPLPSAPKETDK